MASNVEKVKVNCFGRMPFGNHLYGRRSDTMSTDSSCHTSLEYEPHNKYLIALPGATNNADELHEPNLYKSRVQTLEHTEWRACDGDLVAEPDELIDVPSTHMAVLGGGQQQVGRYTKDDLILWVMNSPRDLPHIGAQFNAQLMATLPREHASVWSPGQKTVLDKRPGAPFPQLPKPRSGIIVKSHSNNTHGEGQTENDEMRQKALKITAKCGSKTQTGTMRVRSLHRPQVKLESVDKMAGQVLDGMDSEVPVAAKDELVSLPKGLKSLRRRSSCDAVESLSETLSKVDINEFPRSTSPQPGRPIFPAASSVTRAVPDAYSSKERTLAGDQGLDSILGQPGTGAEEDAQSSSSCADVEMHQDDGDKLLACIFWKHSPHRHQRCATLVARDLAALKQHFERQHLRPAHYCSKCYITFPTAVEKDKHVRACQKELRDPYVKNTLNAEAMKLYKKKIYRKRRGQKDEDERSMAKLTEIWMNIFRAQFPDHPRPMSPYVGKLTDQMSVMHFTNIFNACPKFRSGLQDLIDGKTNFGVPLASSTRLVVAEALNLTQHIEDTASHAFVPGQPDGTHTDFSGPTMAERESFVDFNALLSGEDIYQETMANFGLI